MRDVSIDEVFKWKEDFGAKAKDAFGGRRVYVSPQTFSDLKSRCEKLDRELDPFFERGNLSSAPVPLNGIRVYMVRVGEVPDGILRGHTGGGKLVPDAKA